MGECALNSRLGSEVSALIVKEIYLILFLLFFSLHLRICLEREEMWEREKERERGRERIVCTSTGHPTCNLLACGTTVQPAEPPSQCSLILDQGH